MAPNIPLGAIYQDSEEFSDEVVLEIQPAVPVIVPEVPKLFLPHLPQHFQDPDSPNLHQVTPINSGGDSKPQSRSPQPSPTVWSLRPSNPRTAILEEELQVGPDRVTLVEEVSNFDFQNRNGRRRFNARDSLRDSQPSPSFIESTLLPRTIPALSNNPSSNPKVSSIPSNDEKVSINNPSTIQQVPAIQISGRVPPSDIQHSTKDIPTQESSGRQQILRSTRPPPTGNSGALTSTSTTRSHLDLGVLKLPGHEPEAPADLVLIHHDRDINTHNQTGVGGIFVKDESTSLTNEGATALILVGLCSVFLVFICFIMFVQKIKRQKFERKVGQNDDGGKPSPRYEATGNTTTYHHPNPLSYLPPDILHALMHPIAATKVEEVYEEPKPSFLTMEPPQPGSQIGRLWFSIYYDYMKSTLALHILHARYVKGRGSSTNPGTVWVEACVLTPMNTIKATNKTDTRRASLAPVFNQSFKFQVEDEEVTQFLLRLTLYDKHPQNGEKAVGSVIVPLCTVDLCSTDTISRDLQ